MKLVYTEPSRDDIASIYDYNARRSTLSAARVERSIRAACKTVADFPGASPRTNKPNVHRAPMVRYPYTIYYRVKSDLGLVEILRVVYSPTITDLDTLPG